MLKIITKPFIRELQKKVGKLAHVIGVLFSGINSAYICGVKMMAGIHSVNLNLNMDIQTSTKTVL